MSPSLFPYPFAIPSKLMVYLYRRKLVWGQDLVMLSAVIFIPSSCACSLRGSSLTKFHFKMKATFLFHIIPKRDIVLVCAVGKHNLRHACLLNINKFQSPELMKDTLSVSGKNYIASN